MNPDVFKHKQFMQQSGMQTMLISSPQIYQLKNSINTPEKLNSSIKNTLSYQDLESSQAISSPKLQGKDLIKNIPNNEDGIQQNSLPSRQKNNFDIQHHKKSISESLQSPQKQDQTNSVQDINNHDRQDFKKNGDTYIFNVYDFNELPEIPGKIITNSEFFIVSKHIRRKLNSLNFYYNSDNVESQIKLKILQYNNMVKAKQAVYEQNMNEKRDIYNELSLKFRQPQKTIKNAVFHEYDALLEEGLRSSAFNNHVTFKDKIFPGHLAKDQELDSSTLEAILSLYQSNFPGKLFIIPPDYHYSDQLKNKVNQQAKYFFQCFKQNNQTEATCTQTTKFAMVYESSLDNHIDVSKLLDVQQSESNQNNKAFNDIVIFYPFCENNHWSALLYSSQYNIIYIVDSMFAKSKRDVEQYTSVIEEILKINGENNISQNLNQENDKQTNPQIKKLSSSKQDNSFDCGLCLLYILHTFLLLPEKAKTKIEFTKLDIANYRFYFMQYFLWHSHIVLNDQQSKQYDKDDDGIYDISSSSDKEINIIDQQNQQL